MAKSVKNHAMEAHYLVPQMLEQPENTHSVQHLGSYRLVIKSLTL